jgi:hypothetical protein
VQLVLLTKRNQTIVEHRFGMGVLVLRDDHTKCIAAVYSNQRDDSPPVSSVAQMRLRTTPEPK